jgi:arginase
MEAHLRFQTSEVVGGQFLGEQSRHSPPTILKLHCDLCRFDFCASLNYSLHSIFHLRIVMAANRYHEVIGAAFGLGSSRTGTWKAPNSLRQHGLLERLRTVDPHIVDGGDCSGSTSTINPGDPKARFKNEIVAFGKSLFSKLRTSYQAGNLPIVIGGDHSISIATIAAASAHLKEVHGPGARLGILWVDAHADINTPETSPSGHIHGMTLAAALGLCDEELSSIGGPPGKILTSDIIYIGLRDLDPGEREILKEHKITCFTMKDIDLLGIGPVCQRAYAQLEQNSNGFIMSFDVDVCDPVLAPGVGTPVRGGLTLRESYLVMEMAAESSKLMSAELVELNPELDTDGRTTELSINLLESVVGKRIL